MSNLFIGLNPTQDKYPTMDGSHPMADYGMGGIFDTITSAISNAASGAVRAAETAVSSMTNTALSSVSNIVSGAASGVANTPAVQEAVVQQATIAAQDAAIKSMTSTVEAMKSSLASATAAASAALKKPTTWYIIGGVAALALGSMVLGRGRVASNPRRGKKRHSKKICRKVKHVRRSRRTRKHR